MKNSRYIILFFIVLTIAFIWGNSTLSQEQSNQVSQTVREVVNKIVPANEQNPDGSFSNHFIRKAAHVFEYATLGVLLAVLIDKITLKQMGFALAFGVVIASFDETIQIFFQRGPAVRDVMIDTCGLVCGMLCVYFIRILSRELRRRKE